MVGSATEYGISGGGAGFGFGGWGGGGWGGIAPVGLFGVLGNRGFGDHDGHDKGHDDCTKHQLDMIDSNLGDLRTQVNLDSRFNAVEAKQNTIQLEGLIHSVDNRVDTFKDFALVNFGELKRENALLGKDVVIAEKNMTHIVDKCCCDIQKNDDAHFAALQMQAEKNTCAILTSGDRNTQKILDKLCDQEAARLRDEIAELRNFRNIRNTADIVAATTVRATTNGSNFNTGSQLQSNNSGQQVGIA